MSEKKDCNACITNDATFKITIADMEGVVIDSDDGLCAECFADEAKQMAINAVEFRKRNARVEGPIVQIPDPRTVLECPMFDFGIKEVECKHSFFSIDFRAYSWMHAAHAPAPRITYIIYEDKGLTYWGPLADAQRWTTFDWEHWAGELWCYDPWNQ